MREMVGGGGGRETENGREKLGGKKKFITNNNKNSFGKFHLRDQNHSHHNQHKK